MIQGCSRSEGTHGVSDVSVQSARESVLPNISLASNPPAARTRVGDARVMLETGGMGGGGGRGGSMIRSWNLSASNGHRFAKKPAHDDVCPTEGSGCPS